MKTILVLLLMGFFPNQNNAPVASYTPAVIEPAQQETATRLQKAAAGKIAMSEKNEMKAVICLC